MIRSLVYTARTLISNLGEMAKTEALVLRCETTDSVEKYARITEVDLIRLEVAHWLDRFSQLAVKAAPGE